MVPIWVYVAIVGFFVLVGIIVTLVYTRWMSPKNKDTFYGRKQASKVIRRAKNDNMLYGGSIQIKKTSSNEELTAKVEELEKKLAENNSWRRFMLGSLSASVILRRGCRGFRGFRGFGGGC